MKATRSHKKRYRVTDRPKRRKHGSHYQILSAVLGFLAATLSILLLPLGLLHWGYKSHQNKRKSPKSFACTQGHPSRDTKKKNSAKGAPSRNHSESAATPKKKRDSYSRECSCRADRNEGQQVYTPPSAVSIPNSPAPVPDENPPKSTPKNAKDQYIRKRMTLDVTADCDLTALTRLKIGSYLDLTIHEGLNISKGNHKVKLTFDGSTVGYVPIKDQTPYVASVKLGREIYEMITGIYEKGVMMEYEFETWYEGGNP